MSVDAPETNGVGDWSIWTILFLVLLAAGWLHILSVTVTAVQTLGLAASTTTFSQDMTHPWRAQYNTDFLLHVALMAIWILYRTRSRTAGVVLALMTVNVAIFTLPYVFILTILAKGDMRKVILGWRLGGYCVGSPR